MNIQADMVLTSHGYLNEVVEENNQTIARICKIQIPELAGGESEAIWLDCAIADEKLKKLLRDYQSALAKGHAVVVRFSAKYLATVGYQSGMAENDPANIVTMKTQLTDVMEIYQDGVQHYPEKSSNIVNFRSSYN